ncbi:cap-specific mRNA (nucleoside-2'-O-)-methyltransferase 1-like [Hylaeus anthracinus]|uniref:cap-specific mRNA (nucleoside-2'-O-)-methyltransferase 1-like n=1 Tax=Hylaeus anthracinus TaxID=313031 RepID=UPI0023B925DB|nr:cap-specific mRNA (nucleoside-2'-O-)-methyltransferase 1-like [Hylaeus anthracinus]
MPFSSKKKKWRSPLIQFVKGSENHPPVRRTKDDDIEVDLSVFSKWTMEPEAETISEDCSATSIHVDPTPELTPEKEITSENLSDSVGKISIVKADSLKENILEPDNTVESAPAAAPEKEKTETKINVKDTQRAKILRIMKSMGYKTGQGLGKRNQGWANPVSVISNYKRRGLGYHKYLVK